jgi:hypothetical protein
LAALFYNVFIVKWRLAVEQLEAQNSKRPPVDLYPVLPTKLDHFGRRVLIFDTLLIASATQHRRVAKMDQLNVPVLGDQNTFNINVPVHDTLAVQLHQSENDLRAVELNGLLRKHFEHRL